MTLVRRQRSFAWAPSDPFEWPLSTIFPTESTAANCPLSGAAVIQGLVRIAAEQPVKVVFPSSPGQVYTSIVALVPTDIVGGQVSAEDINSPIAAISGVSGIYPVHVNFPMDADPALKRAGAAASVTFFTDEGNPINTLANILQGISSWTAYIF
jgi:hypothetical protein